MTDLWPNAYLEERSKQMVKTCLLINMGATWPGILDVFIRHTQGKLFKSLTYNSSFRTPLIFLLCVCQSAKKYILALFLAYMLFGSKTIYGRGVQKPGCFSNAKKINFTLCHIKSGEIFYKNNFLFPFYRSKSQISVCLCIVLFAFIYH